MSSRSELAPLGVLRAAINLGNSLLAYRDPESGELSGVSVDLVRELARRLQLPAAYVPFEAARQSAAALKAGDVDLVFLAIDSVRALDMDFSPPYVRIEGAYLVRNESPLHDNEDIDREGIRVLVAAGSAYDLFLSRQLRMASIVRVDTSSDVVARFEASGCQVAGGVKQQLVAATRGIPGLRLLPGKFMVIDQALATPRERPAAARYLTSFVDEVKADGFVARALERHGVEGALIAPASSGRQ